ncbi:MAG: hypothetical protein IJY35_14855 [Clostridia bacterium]|nr:hypothetical protein [Clostridia bacterium]
MQKYLRILPFLAVTAADFWLIPLFMNETNVMLLVLCVMPFVCFVTSYVCGLVCSFQPMYLFGVEMLFLPTVWVYYNESAMVYMLVYAVIAALGCAVGALMKKAFARKTDAAEDASQPEETQDNAAETTTDN